MPEIRFDKEEHKYYLGDKELISVTQLLAKHHLSPDYSGVDEKTLKAKAERGTLIHKEIEDWIKNNEVGFTTEFDNFCKWAEKCGIRKETMESEVLMHNDIIAGTCDLFFYDEDGAFCIADIKTTSTLHKDSVSWQLSIYDYLNSGLCERGYALHFHADGSLSVVNIPLKPYEEVQKLLDCERRGELYNQSTDNLLNLNQLAIVEEAERVIAKAKKDIEQAEARKKEVYDTLLKTMEERAIMTYETDNIKITYIAPFEKTTIDTAKLKKSYPEIAELCSRTTEQKASIRIKLKGE